MNTTEDPRADFIRGILSHVEAGKAQWSVEEFPDGACEIQLHYVDNGNPYHGIKWTIGVGYTVEAILTAAFHALMAAANDSLRHSFHYRGKAIFTFGDCERKKFLESVDEKRNPTA